MNINFHPDNENFIEEAKEYQKIWDKEGSRIIAALENAGKMKFKENTINAIIFEGISHSHPLTLRASYSADVKKSTLVHELAHRLVVGNNMKTNNALEAHKLINGFLYDAWIVLYGKEFADAMVKIEGERTPMYKEAWDWTFSNKKEQ